MSLIGTSAIENFFIGLFAILILLIISHVVVKKLVRLSHLFNISQLFLGLTILSIGTSLPEIITHIIASIDIMQGGDYRILSSTVLGTNVGSDIVQQIFLLGFIALIAKITITKKFLKRDFVVMIITAVLMMAFSLNNTISRGEGFVLVVGYLGYMYYLFTHEKEHWLITYHCVTKNHASKRQIMIDLVCIFCGIMVMAVCADTILKIITYFVTAYTIGASLLGVIVLGIATVIPELTTALCCIRHKAPAISLGVLIGSNITNPALGLGIGALISTYFVPSPVLWYDLPVKIVTAIGIWLLFLWKGTISKKEALVLMSAYVVYVLLRILYFAVDV